MKAEKNYWLLKSEEAGYSIDDLKRDKKTAWTGIRNYQSRNFMRDSMQVGDLCLFYHSNSEPTGVVGVAKVVSKSYADPTQFDRSHYYFDEKSKKEDPTWMLVDIAFVKKLKHCVTLAEIKNDPALEGMMLRRRARLSVQPVSEKHFRYITEELS
ncbi:MAG: hypothetical protein JWM46_141 [Candidatus Kaiserbacteria bacterium]|nr:hypothetical protein [Candidatus Kaiserbacteria bacterium]